ncbi:MAG: DUF3822 family protein [Tannerellaceae bacterium]|jgi:hypothetical protein|nr:DUF3822 family protein [Tannerellaceae bacterium]
MTISVPDTLNVNNSEKYIMSIRLWPGGFSFSAYNPAEAQSFFFRDVEFDRSVPYINSLKELFFSNDSLIWAYNRSRILCVSPQYTLVPNEYANEKRNVELLRYNVHSPGRRCLTNKLEEEKAELVFAIDEDVYEFCSRTLTNPVYIHHLTSQIIMLKKQCRGENHKHLYAVVHHSLVDICCFEGNDFLFANSFAYEQPNDLLYYILYVWKQIGLDQLYDYCSIYGDLSATNRVIHALHTYIKHIDRIELPAKAYFLGGEILYAPIDLILMSVCE